MENRNRVMLIEVKGNILMEQGNKMMTTKMSLSIAKHSKCSFFKNK